MKGEEKILLHKTNKLLSLLNNSFSAYSRNFDTSKSRGDGRQVWLVAGAVVDGCNTYIHMYVHTCHNVAILSIFFNETSQLPQQKIALCVLRWVSSK